MYNLLVYKLPKYDKISEKILNENNLYLLLPCPTHSLFKLGYHHFIDRTREAISITHKLDTKNDFYYVVNKFETKIISHSDTIEKKISGYINETDYEMSLDFYKYWEIFFIFDIINSKTKNIALLSTNPTDIMLCLNKFSEKILNIDCDNINFNIIDILFDEKENYSSKQFYGKTKKTKTIGTFIKENAKNKEYQDLVIGNGTYDLGLITDSKERETHILIIGEIYGILNIQEKNGNMVLKIFDSFTYITIKMIYILCYLYEDVYIYKPLLSKLSETEKFIVCKNFKFSQSDKQLKNIISNLEKILKNNNELYLNDIFLDFEIPNDLINVFRFINTRLVNEQQILINEIVKYIKENNYYGDKYHNYLNEQIEATKWWLNIFIPSNSYKTNKDITDKMLNAVLEKNIIEKEKLISNFI